MVILPTQSNGCKSPHNVEPAHDRLLCGLAEPPVCPGCHAEASDGFPDFVERELRRLEESETRKDLAQIAHRIGLSPKRLHRALLDLLASDITEIALAIA